MSRENLRKLATLYPQSSFWVDSFAEENMRFGLHNAARGVTTAPTVTRHTLLEEYDHWRGVLRDMAEEFPTLNEQELLWEWMYRVSAERSRLLLPLYGDGTTTDGHYAIQLNIYDYRNGEKMLAQARRIAALGKNLIVKIPTTKAGLDVMEAAVAEGISVMSTGTSSVAQIMAAAAALERGLQRRRAAGLPTDTVCTMSAIQLGFQDTCIRNWAAQNGVALSDDALRLGAVAVTKKAYRLLKERNCPTRLVLSNFTADEHWQEFLGGDLVLTMPRKWLDRVDDYDGALESAIDRDVPEAVTEELLGKIPHFAQEYQEDGMMPGQFEHFIPFIRTVRMFMDLYDEALQKVRDAVIPDLYAGETPRAGY